MDFAIIETGGKQYKIIPGQELQVEKLPVSSDNTYIFDKVLMISSGDNIKIGKPYLKETIEVEVKRQIRGKKIRILRFKAKARYRKHQGHRQSLSIVEISSTKKTTKKSTKKTTKTKTVAKKATKK